MQIMYAISSSVFAAIFLVAIIVYGNDAARAIAIAAAWLACASQFTAQDAKAWRVSIVLAYAAFIAGGLAFWFFIGASL